MKTILILSALTLPLVLSVGCASSRSRTTSHNPPPQPREVVVVREPSPAPPSPEVVVVRQPSPPPSRPEVIVMRQPRPAPRNPKVVAARESSTSRRNSGSSDAKEPVIHVTISDRERQIIRDYLTAQSDSPRHSKKGDKAKALPPGLAKKAARGQSLPPGWQKKMVQGQTMPEQVYRQCEPLPDEVVIKLPPQPAGTIIVTIEGKVARLVRATMEILDVFDVFQRD